jgi:hypothetical protein
LGDGFESWDTPFYPFTFRKAMEVDPTDWTA